MRLVIKTVDPYVSDVPREVCDGQPHLCLASSTENQHQVVRLPQSESSAERWLDHHSIGLTMFAAKVKTEGLGYLSNSGREERACKH